MLQVRCWLLLLLHTTTTMINAPVNVRFVIVPEIHKKVSSKEVLRGSISAVTLNSSRGEDSEEKKPCCRNIWSLRLLGGGGSGAHPSATRMWNLREGQKGNLWFQRNRPSEADLKWPISEFAADGSWKPTSVSFYKLLLSEQRSKQNPKLLPMSLFVIYVNMLKHLNTTCLIKGFYSNQLLPRWWLSSGWHWLYFLSRNK